MLCPRCSFSVFFPRHGSRRRKLNKISQNRSRYLWRKFWTCAQATMKTGSQMTSSVRVKYEAIKTATISPQSRNFHDTNEVNRPAGKASFYNSRQQRGRDNLNIFPLLISRTYKPLLTFLLCYALLPSFLLLDRMPGPSSNPVSLSSTAPHKLKIEDRWKYQFAFIKKCQMADTKQEGKNARQSPKFMRTLFKSSAIFLSLSGFSRVFIGPKK